MFVRFRETARRLQISLVETARSGGCVHHEHIASLGSILNSQTPADRIAFWTKLHQRMATLSNRVDSTMQSTILAAVHARIPMPTRGDHQAVQLEYAKGNAQLWATLSEAQGDQVAGLKALAAKTLANATAAEPAAELTKANAEAARARLAKAEQGEDVGVVAKPMSHKELMRLFGWTESDIRHARRLDLIERLGVFDEMLAEIIKRNRRNEKSVARGLVEAAYRAKVAASRP